MKMRLLYFWESVRTSFWFIPALMVFSAIALSMIMVTVDSRISLDGYRGFAFAYTGAPDGARSVLSTIAGSMITVAGVAFSITIVALTLASSQFGPRLLRNFMQDTGHQVVLGTFIATFIYCLLILRTVHGVGDEVFVPSLSVTFAVVLALINVGVLIYFIHHVAGSIQADQVIASVYGELVVHMKRLFPEELGYERESGGPDRVVQKPEIDRNRHSHRLGTSQNGYLQAIESEGLFALARQHDLVLHLHYQPGKFIVPGSTLVTVQSHERLEDEVAEQIVDSFVLGAQRTPEQDAEFAIHQLVEVAVRALSPGINDPFTAIACIDRLGSALCCLTNRAFPSPYRYDDEGRLRVIAKPITFEGITNAAFDQIRQYGRSSVAVTIRLLEALHLIAVQTRHPDQRQAILRQAHMLERGSRDAFSEAEDREDVHQRYHAVLDALNEQARLPQAQALPPMHTR
jgi:uncharacterized membrane protein